MKRSYIIFFLFLLRITISLAHIDPIPLTEGKLIPNNSFKGNYAMDFQITGSSNVFLEDIGVEFFNVGNDDVSTLYFSLYEIEHKNLIKYSDTIINSVYNQTVFIKMMVSLEPNKTYKLVVGSKDVENDDVIGLFQPNYIPYQNLQLPLNVTNLSFDNSSYPSVNSNLIPFLSFGYTSQKGIDFIAYQKISKHISENKTLEYKTQFIVQSEKVKIINFGMTYFDVGKNGYSNLRFFIKDTLSGLYLFHKDTLIENLHAKSIDCLSNIDLEAFKVYEVGVKNLDIHDTDNILFTYKPSNLPYFDNLNFIEIYKFYKNELEDSLGVAFFMSYKKYENTSALENINNESFVIKELENEYVIEGCTALYNNGNLFLFDATGKDISRKIDFENDRIKIKKSKMIEGVYFLQTTYPINHTSKIMINTN